MNFVLNVQKLRKILFAIFLIYICWFKEVFSDVPIILYASVLLLTFLCLLNTRIEWENNLCIHPFIKVLLLFGIYAFITGIFVSINKNIFWDSMVTFFEFMVVLVDCSIISYHEGDWEWILKIFLILSLLCAIQTVIWGQPYMNGVIVTTMSSHNNPNSLAHIMLIGMYALVATRKRAMSYFYIKVAVMLLFLYVIFLTGSRKGLIAAGIFILFWIITVLTDEGKEEFVKKIIVLVGILAVCVIGYWYIKNYYMASDSYIRMQNLFTDENSNYKRITLYKEGISLWKRFPIFGAGFNQFKVYSQFGYYSHSTYIETLSCCGILGTLLLFVPIVQYGVKIVKNLKTSNNEKKYAVRVALIALLVELFLAIGNIWFYGFTHMGFIVTFLGMFDNWRTKDVENQDST